MLGTTQSSEGQEALWTEDMPRMTCQKLKKENFFSVEPSAGKKEKGISLCKALAHLPANTNDTLYFLQTFQARCLTKEMCIDPDVMGGTHFMPQVEKGTYRDTHGTPLTVQNADWETSNLLLGSCAGKGWWVESFLKTCRTI